MKTSNNGLLEIASYEGLAQTKYKDGGGVQTIGIGSTVSEIKDIADWAWDKVLTIEECLELFRKSLVKYEKAINTALTVDVTQLEFDALVSITYNIGTGAMAGSTFMRRLNANDKPERVANAMKMFCNDNGHRIQGLVNRRNKEALLFVNGMYSNDGLCDKILVNPTRHTPIYNGRIDLRPYLYE